jgi:hypothetical protein
MGLEVDLSSLGVTPTVLGVVTRASRELFYHEELRSIKVGSV